MELRTPRRNGSAPAGNRLSARPSARSRLPRRLAIAVLVATLPVLTACAANFSAQTQQQYQPAVGTDDRDGDVYVINAVIVADQAGNGTVVTTLISQQSDDYLQGFSAEDSKGGALKTNKLPAITGSQDPNAPSNGIALPAQQSVKIPDDGALQVSGDTITPGTFATLTLTFVEAAPATIDVPVVPRSGPYIGTQIRPIETPSTSESTPAS